MPTLDLVAAPPVTPTAADRRPGRWRRRADRRRLTRYDLHGAQRAGLHTIAALVGEARQLVDAGWVQSGWFVVRGVDGQPQVVTAYNAHRIGHRPVVAACLVGAVVQAGGGLSAVHTQPVQRALDLTWHTLFADGREPVRWCPAPQVRALHVRDLTRWNDQQGRTRAEVSELLRAVEVAAVAEADRVAAMAR